VQRHVCSGAGIMLMRLRQHQRRSDGEASERPTQLVLVRACGIDKATIR